MEGKLLGIIGGMGPKATSVFFDMIVENTVAKSDQDHIDIIILNHATLPDRTSVILENKDALFLQAIKKDIEILSRAGVANIAIPCNTSHYFYDQMVEMTNVNIINMVEETAKTIQQKFGSGSKVGLLATRGTAKSGIYRKACERNNLNLYTPNEEVQTKIMDIIYHDIKGNLDVDTSGIEAIIQHLLTEENCQCVIIACTELSCIKLSDELENYCVDAMKVLVKKSIELSGKKAK